MTIDALFFTKAQVDYFNKQYENSHTIQEYGETADMILPLLKKAVKTDTVNNDFDWCTQYGEFPKNHIFPSVEEIKKTRMERINTLLGKSHED